MSKAVFDFRDALSMVTERLTYRGGMSGLHRLAEHMAGEPVFTHQLTRLQRECARSLIRQSPVLARLDLGALDRMDSLQFLDEVRRLHDLHGPTIEIAPMTADEHERIDPFSELAEKIHPDQIMALNVVESGND